MTKRRDARSLDHGVLEEMRRMAVKAVLAGETQASVSKRLEVHFNTVSKWVAAYRTGGDLALASSKSTGPKRKLSDRNIETVKRIIVSKNPRQLNFGPALWTVALVTQLLQVKFGVVLDQSNVWRLLRHLGISPQKPVRRAFQRDEAEIRHWLEREFPGIVRLAKRKQATLLFLDETGVHEDHPVGRTWAPQGKTPEVRVSGMRRRTNVISAVSPRGRLWFRGYRGTLTAERYEEFLKDLLDDVKGKIVLIHDRHPAHRAARVRRMIQQHRGRLFVFELPSYAPELNPDEHVWCYLKQSFRSSPVMQNEDFAGRVQASMDTIAADRKLVRSFFDHPEVRYVKEALRW